MVGTGFQNNGKKYKLKSNISYLNLYLKARVADPDPVFKKSKDPGIEIRPNLDLVFKLWSGPGFKTKSDADQVFKLW